MKQTKFMEFNYLALDEVIPPYTVSDGAIQVDNDPVTYKLAVDEPLRIIIDINSIVSFREKSLEVDGSIIYLLDIETSTYQYKNIDLPYDELFKIISSATNTKIIKAYNL